MGVIMAERTLKRTAQRYRRSTRKQKARILDEFVATHDCTRNHASWLLRSWGKTVFSHQGGELVKIVVGQRRTLNDPACTARRSLSTARFRAVWAAGRGNPHRGASGRPARESRRGVLAGEGMSLRQERKLLYRVVGGTSSEVRAFSCCKSSGEIRWVRLFWNDLYVQYQERFNLILPGLGAPFRGTYERCGPICPPVRGWFAWSGWTNSSRGRTFPYRRGRDGCQPQGAA